ncbi:transporter substrate-binding domain-containing protein [Pseudomonas sp. SG20056]|uniref:substrate-binding periplasmic protein n=1 Tax=Pseudomonas sp. SG20056 TaxID=3074146 RepID=UPI00287F4D9F|nr:transporter substrate-binding domain-containing protein [Pseudomonas sp. SG20056]WNF45027.1 transporter substrate-binding domain-containing protein [Pseudomonas sp. SG20056]
MASASTHRPCTWPNYLQALLVLALLFLPTSQATERLNYPLHSDGIDPEAYALALLTAALERTPGRYQLQPTPVPMAQSRALLAIEHDSKSVQVMWTMTTREREVRLLPIRIPIYRGLIGWRVLLQRSAEAEQLATVRNLDELKRFSFGQRHDWPDTAILRANGLKVVTSQHYRGLFQMLAAGRFDLFPREVVVAWQEQVHALENGLALSIDNHLLLHYPTAFYFFTSRNRADLAADIERGLEAMIADGSFQRLFEQYHGDTLRQANLHQRRIIELHNPDLPPATPFARKELWFQPKELK